MNEFDPMDFDDLKPVEIPVKYRGARYLLLEGTEDAVRQYQNLIFKSTKLVDGKPSTVEGFADIESFLLSLCLVSVTVDPKTSMESRKPVSLADIRKWPHKVIKPLVKRLKQISDLSRDNDDVDSLKKRIAEDQERLDLLTKTSEEDRLKNEPGDTAAISNSQTV